MKRKMVSTIRDALVILLSIVILQASSASLDVDRCAEGETYWCQSLANAEICSAVDICKQTIWKAQKLEEDDSNICLFCKSIVSDARQMSADGKSQEEVLVFVSSANDLLPESEKASQNKRAIESNTFSEILNSEIAPQTVCSLLDVCTAGPQDKDPHKLESSPANKTPELQQLREEDNSLEPKLCNDCKTFLSVLKQLLNKQTSALLTDLIIEKGCARTTTFKTQCENAAKLLPNIINVLTSFLDENIVCRKIRMCPGSEIESEENAFEIDLPSVDLQGLASFLDKNSQQRQAVDEFRQSNLCPDCNSFFKTLKTFLDNETSAFITDLLIKACKGRRACESAIRSTVPSVITFALNFLDPGKVCKSTRLCPTEVNLNSFTWSKILSSSDTSMLLDSSSCLDCTKFITSVKTLLTGDASTFISDVLIDKICPLTGSFRKQCEDFAKMYLKVVVDLVASGLDPDKVCKSIGMCKKSEDDIEQDLFIIDLSLIDWDTLIGNQDSNSMCDKCKTGVQFVQNFVKNDAVKNSIAMIIEKFICVRLGPFRMPCEKMIGSALRGILDKIARLLDPSKVCRFLRMCKNSNVLVDENTDDSFPDPEVLGMVGCTVCETVVGLVRSAIDTNQTEEEILKGMHGLCTHLPSKYTVKVCHRFVNNYGQRVIESIREKLQPHDICVTFRLCDIFVSFDLLDEDPNLFA